MRYKDMPAGCWTTGMVALLILAALAMIVR